VAIALSGLGVLLTGCHVPVGTVQREVLVEFTTPNSAAAKPVVIAQCGHLPGVSVFTSTSLDPNVHLDVSKATDTQIGAVSTCVGNLQTAQPGLHIRDFYLNDDGS
jgi:hypothetical protein